MNICFLDWTINPAQEENRAMESGSTYVILSVIRVCFIKTISFESILQADIRAGKTVWYRPSV
jgi:hypothetical protein